MKQYIIAILAILLLTTPVKSHSWYDPDCCGGNDCEPVKIQNDSNGDFAILKNGQKWYIIRPRSIRPSKDDHNIIYVYIRTKSGVYMFQQEYKMINPIKLIDTKILLQVLNEFRVFNTCNKNREEKYFTSGHYMYEIINDKLYVYVPTSKTFGPADMKFKSVLMDENSVRLELSTREHVPNKLERKQIRRNKDKAQKNQ